MGCYTIRQSSFFPYISQESDLWVSRTSIENVRDIIMQNDAKIRLVLERNGIFLISSRPEVRKNLYTEFIHRITRRKVISEPAGRSIQKDLLSVLLSEEVSRRIYLTRPLC